MSLKKLLVNGLQTMVLELPAQAVQKQLDYLALLDKWNRSYNLTSVREPEAMVSRHLLDSLSILPYLQVPRVLDVGTGAGLPGIPLALALPDVHFSLLDSNAKKTRFVRYAVHHLALQNVEVIQERVEKFHPEKKFDTLVTRAFAAIPDMLESCGHVCVEGGRIIAMKGVYPQEELVAIPGRYKVTDVHALQVPALGSERHVVIIRPRLERSSG